LAFGLPAPRLASGFPCGALRRFARASPGAVDGVVPAAVAGDYPMTNIVILVGNLGADPELRSASSGTDVATFSLGTSRPKRDSEGKTFKDESGFTAKDTEWHRITCFNGLGRVVSQHATKGMLVSVRGRLHYTRWTDREGVDRYGCEVIADDVQFLGRGRPAGEAESASPELELADELAS
jgi:single-strand DNA-binding protein